MKLRRWFAWLLLAFGVNLVAVAVTYLTIPQGTTQATHFDTLIVLGSPCEDDGQPGQDQRQRVLEAVREFKAGRADHMIVTGGATLNENVEAECMARLAEEQGIPAAAVVVEPRAENTIQNLYYSNKIMRANGWQTAEVISSPSHIRRAALILTHYGFGWRVHAAPWPAGYTWTRVAELYAFEAEGTSVLRWFGFGKNAFVPGSKARW